jgi:hypothetical protein
MVWNPYFRHGLITFVAALVLGIAITVVYENAQHGASPPRSEVRGSRSKVRGPRSEVQVKIEIKNQKSKSKLVVKIR